MLVLGHDHRLRLQLRVVAAGDELPVRVNVAFLQFQAGVERLDGHPAGHLAGEAAGLGRAAGDA